MGMDISLFMGWLAAVLAILFFFFKADKGEGE